ncbi:MAG: GntR family transcriptional regulator, partial [bacterium]|nr:GntR family transcriptional regulator [bacterium]
MSLNGFVAAPAVVPAINRSQATMDAIKRLILSRRLATGDPLPTESALCEDLGVSRSSVREALRKLEALDIVTVHQGRGTFVGEMSMQPLVETLVLRGSLGVQDGPAALREVIDMRRYLDLGMSAAVVAALKGTDDAELTTLVETMVAKAKRRERFQDEDIAFHRALIAKLGNRTAEQIVSAMWLVHMTVIPDLHDHVDAGLEDTAAAHGHMLEAARAG